MKHYSTNNS